MSLSGIRLVSLAQNVPGPVAVARLAAEGAQATKIEPPSGDPLATLCPGWYEELHQQVAVERVDVKSPAGLARVRALAADADLFITSQRPSALARLAVDHASLVGACPQLRLLRIVGSIREPEAPGHDLTYQASAGLLQERLPVTLVADLMAAERAVGAALLLLRRPAGSVMDVGLSDSLAPLQAPLRHGLTAPGGLLGGGLPEYGIYDAKDGRVAVAALEPHFRQRLVERLRLATTDGLAEAFRARTVKEWQDWAHDNDVPLVGVD